MDFLGVQRLDLSGGTLPDLRGHIVHPLPGTMSLKANSIRQIAAQLRVLAWVGLASLAWGCQAEPVNEVPAREVSRVFPVPTFTPTPDLAGHKPALQAAETVTPVPPLPTEALKTGQADVCTRSQVVRQLIVEALDLKGCEDGTW